MIYHARTAQIAPGKGPDAMGFGKNVVAYLKSKHGITCNFMTQVGGPVGRVAWLTAYDSLGAYEQTWAKLMADPGWVELLKAGPTLFAPGQTQDSLWTVQS
jgi:hypothetical protein